MVSVDFVQSHASFAASCSSVTIRSKVRDSDISLVNVMDVVLYLYQPCIFTKMVHIEHMGNSVKDLFSFTC